MDRRHAWNPVRVLSTWWLVLWTAPSMRDPSAASNLVNRQRHHPSMIDAWPSLGDVLLHVSQSSTQWQIALKLLGQNLFLFDRDCGLTTRPKGEDRWILAAGYGNLMASLSTKLVNGGQVREQLEIWETRWTMMHGVFISGPILRKLLSKTRQDTPSSYVDLSWCVMIWYDLSKRI